MPRVARIVGYGYPHHIIQRGNNRENVFLDDDDKYFYLKLLKRYSERTNTSILSYCLMTNHVHLLLNPKEEKSLAKMMQGVALCYTQYFNKKNDRTGRLWECRYYSSVVDRGSYLWAVSRYIENNPVRAKIVSKAVDYSYSSASYHLTGKDNFVINEPFFEEGERDSYKKFIAEDCRDEEVGEIRKKTLLGHPLGDLAFIDRLSKLLGRKLVFRGKGRPKKED
ncbi:MAG: transposase [Deltaproteobacteria bacterium]|nr:transposase [Deltaproteobacteria bacterium]